MRLPCIVFAFTLVTGVVPALGAEKAETPHLEFVTEYVRELGAIEKIRADAEKEQEHSTNEAMLNAIHASMIFQFELRSQITTLKRMHLSGAEYDQIIPTLIRL
jgi:hypothetical protein